MSLRGTTGRVREPQAGAVRASSVAALLRGAGRDARREAIVATVAGLFLSAIGAFNTGAAPLAPRTGYWLVVMWAGAALGFIASQAVQRVVSFERRPWLSSAVLTVVLAAPMTLFTWLMTAWVFHLPLTPRTLMWLAGPVLLICAAMIALNQVADRQPRQTHAAPEQPLAPAGPRFSERLPFALKGAQVYAVQSEDHYLRLHTSRGSDLILMRLADAIAELEGVEGAQTHRSWWVAKDAVTAARSADGRAILTLTSGVEAPVSRTYVKALRQAGWW